MTSSPAAGFPVVPFLSVPLKFCAEEMALSRTANTATTILEEEFKLWLLFCCGERPPRPVPVGPFPPGLPQLLPQAMTSATGSLDPEVSPPAARNSSRACSHKSLPYFPPPIQPVPFPHRVLSF